MKISYSVLLVFCIGYLSAADYYVSPTGNDNNPGTLALPWKKIQKAASTAGPGSNVYIRGGVYFEKVEMGKSGTAGNYITFTTYPGEEVILDGTGVGGQAMIDIYKKNYIRIIGLHIRNNAGNFAAGILIEFGSRFIEVRNCIIHDIHFNSNPNAPVNSNTNANPFLVYGDHPSIVMTNIICDGNEIYDCRTGFSEALTFDGNVSDFQITNNHVHHITNIGIDMAGHFGACPTPSKDQARNGICKGNYVHHCGSAYATAAGIYVDGGKNIVIEQNKVHNCQWGIEVGCENVGKTTSGITVRNNLLYHNADAGLAFGGYDYPSGSGRVVSSSFINNTLYQNDTTSGGFGELYISSTSKCNFKSNIIFSGAQNKFILKELASASLTLDYNDYYGPGGTSAAKVEWDGTIYTGFSSYVAATAKDQHSIFANPQLTNAAAYDFHLSAGSPAINTGDPAYTGAGITDYDGETRVLGGRVDCGADERFAAALLTMEIPVEAEAPTGILIYPNPAQSTFHIRFDAGDQPCRIEVWDLQGNCIQRTNQSPAGEVKISCEDWAPGVYLVRVSGGKEYVKKVVVW